MTYKFEQFQAEIIDPTITIDVDSITVQPSKMTIGVNITLENSGGKLYGVSLSDIAVENLEFQGVENLMIRVLEKLKEFEVK